MICRLPLPIHKPLNYSMWRWRTHDSYLCRAVEIEAQARGSHDGVDRVWTSQPRTATGPHLQQQSEQGGHSGPHGQQGSVDSEQSTGNLSFIAILLHETSATSPSNVPAYLANLYITSISSSKSTSARGRIAPDIGGGPSW